MKAKTILLYGRSGAGKSTQIGELSEYVYTKLGKTTRLYTADRGGVDTIQAHINEGLIQVVDIGESNPFVFLNKVARGFVKDAQGKWVPGDLSKVGLVAFESITSICDLLMANMAQQAAAGVNIGGSGGVTFTATGDGEAVKVGSTNMAMFGVAQNTIMWDIWQSQKLPVDYVLWTASVSKDEDTNAGGKVLGPAAAGKALTPEIPRSFQRSFRIDVVPGQGTAAPQHILYMGISTDLNAGNATALGNSRVPLGSDVPSKITPASLTKALELIEKAEQESTNKLRQRIGKK